MPRFVLLRHETPPGYSRGSHWDLMFEQAGALRTWALDELPVDDLSVAAEQLADHRLVYLDYEGPVSGNRGEVRREDAGEFEVLEDGPDQFVVFVRGRKLQGRYELLRATDGRWRIVAFRSAKGE
jgi:hypothetical protein